MSREDDDFFDFEEDKEFEELISKFENFVNSNEYAFFDKEDIIDIIDYYLGWMNIEMVSKAIEVGLQYYPDSPEILLKKVELLAKQNRTIDAMKLLNQIEQDIHNDPHFFLTKGDIYSQMGLSEQAIQEYKKLLNFDFPSKDFVYNIIGSEYLMIDKYAEAIHYLKKSVEISDENNPALYKIYFAYGELNQLDECIKYFEKVIDDSPFNADAWLYMAFCYYDKNDFENALESINFALAINPSDLLIVLKKSDILKELNRYDEAIELLKEYLKKDPQNTYLLNVLAETYNEIADYEKAIQYFHKSLHHNPKNSRAWLGLAEAYAHLSQDNEAISCIHQALQNSNDDPEVIINIGKLYILMEFYEEAIEVLNLIIDKDYKKSETIVWYSIALEKTGYAKEALVLLTDQIYNQNNNDVQLQYCLASILLTYQYRKEGLAILEKALQTDPSKVEIIYEFNRYFETDAEIQSLIYQYLKN